MLNIFELPLENGLLLALLLRNYFELSPFFAGPGSGTLCAKRLLGNKSPTAVAESKMAAFSSGV